MPDLSKLRAYKPPDLEDHAFVISSGQVYRMALVQPDYAIGSLDTGMVGFGRGTWLPASAFTDPDPASRDFTIAAESSAGVSLKRRLEIIEDALPFAAEVWRPDGAMLPVTRAGVTSKDYSTLEATFFPVGPKWEHPLLDRVDPKPTYALESLISIPIVNTTPVSALRAAFTPARMSQGTLTVGVFCNEPALYSVASVGATISPQGQANPASVGVFFSLGTFYAHAFGTQLPILGTAQVLRLFALTWRQNGQMQLYTHTDAGFTAYDGLPLGTVPAFSERELSLGYISGVGGVEGAFMPGAPRLGEAGTPFVSSRVMTHPEVKESLGAWYRHLTGFATFTPAPTPQSIELLKPADAQIVIGVSKKVLVTVLRKGDLDEAITLTAAPDNISLRAQGLVEIVDSDFTSDIFELTLLGEEGLTLGDHSVTLTATTLSGLRSTTVLDLRIFTTAPALPANTTHEWRVYDPVNKTLATMRKNTGSLAPAGDLVLGGLARFSNAWDALIGDGSNYSGYGHSIATVDNVAALSADHTVSWAFHNVNLYPVNTVLFSLASDTNKWDFWQVYRDTQGLRLRVSKGTTVQTVTTSGSALSVPEGVLNLSVRLDADGQVTLENPTLDQTATLPNPGLSGNGRLTLFGTKLSDGTVQGLSAGLALVGSVQTGLVV